MSAVRPELADSELAKELYDRVLRTANYFLHNCKHFAIEVLQTENPTYAEVSEIVGKVAGMIKLLADDFDPMMGQKAFEYCELMSQMGIAIHEGDQIRLGKLVEELGRRPGV